ncbi:MAG: tail fiber domain-containing protein, partial [Candidatus Azobacteroides sp.]|nr:tail fiber domain-containing protein [Candidatus Azobacteroides sp.]
NTANGSQALFYNKTGDNNTANGSSALHDNTTGGGNTATGDGALYYNNGNNNTANGRQALFSNTTGIYNTANGTNALYSNTTGSYNTAIGYNANVNAGDLTNATALGYGATATASNQVTIGNSSVTSIRGYVPWTTISDGRVKKNIHADVPGLSFIKQLQPVTYNLDLDAADNILRAGNLRAGENDSLRASAPVDTKAREAQQKRLYTGFVAQDVEKAAQSIGYDFSGVDVDESGNGLYGLRYSEFIVPLVKAVQELSDQNDVKDATIVSLQDQTEQLQQQVETLTELVNQLLNKENSPVVDTKKSISLAKASLEQNFPNPFNYSTTIRYTLLESFRSASIVVNDNSGRTMKQVSISTPGTSSIQIEGGSLSAGIYYYSLYVDNTLVDTKKMILTK